MKKIRLDPDSLQVMSFTTAPDPGVRGTVQGAQTGYTCYETVGRMNTMCLVYVPSYWGEASCTCPTNEIACPVLVESNVIVCPEPVSTADWTCEGVHLGC